MALMPYIKTVFLLACCQYKQLLVLLLFAAKTAETISEVRMISDLNLSLLSFKDLQ